MSAVLVKGIIISLSLVAAVGVALQHPEVKEWIEEQRQKLADLLRELSEGLDPQTRRQAEAFAFEGQLPTDRESRGIANAAAVATGRDTTGNAATRSLNRQSSATAEELAERRRLGREYLARRNQELLDRQKNKSNLTDACDAQPVDTNQHSGKNDLEFPMHNLQNLEQRSNSADTSSTPIPLYQSSDPNIIAPVAVRALDSGASWGNPFADEFALDNDRSVTPRPTIPPKIPNDSVDTIVADPPISVPASSRDALFVAGNQQDSSESLQRAAPRPESRTVSQTEATPADLDDLSFDELLARALSLSLADQEENERNSLHRTMTEEESVAQAIRESLKGNATAGETRPAPVTASSEQALESKPLIDYSSIEPIHSPSVWNRATADDELYTMTPMMTGVDRPQDSQHISGSSTGAVRTMLDSFITAAGSEERRVPAELWSPSTLALSPEIRPVPTHAQLQDHQRGTGSEGFHTDSESDDFASVHGSVSTNEGSLVEVEDVSIDEMSDDDDGILTPQSWSEIGSEVGDSERSERSDSDTGDDLVRL